MNQKSKAEFMNFINQAAQNLEKFPEIGQITLTKRGGKRQPGVPLKRPLPPRPHPQKQDELNMQKIAQILYGSPKK